MTKARTTPDNLAERQQLGLVLQSLRAYRRQRQAEVAQAVGTHEDTLRNWEKGRSVPEALDLLSLAAHLGMSLDTLVGREPPPQAPIPPRPQPDRVQLGQALAGARLRMGVSVEQAAAAARHEPRSVRNWEQGRSSPDALALVALADLYRISLESLVGRAPLPPREPR